MPRRFASWVGVMLRHPYGVVAVPLLLGMAIPFLVRQNSEWDDVFVRAANHLRAGEGIYQADEGYVYPPFMAAVALPFTFPPTVVERGIWFLVSAACLLLLCRWTWRLAGGGAIPGLRPGPFQEHLIWLTGLACGFRYAIDCLSHQQNDLLVSALVLGGCVALVHRRALLAATCLGVAAGAKCTPLLWCGYLLYRRQWRAAAWLVVVAVGVNLLPNLVHTPAGGGLWLVEWAQRYLAPMTASTYSPGVWYSEPVYNQSLAGAVNRWFALDWAWTANGLTVFNKANPASPLILKALLYSFELALVGGACWCLGRCPVRSDAPEATRPSREILEYSMVLLLMVLLAPMSSKPHFCTLLLSGFCLARRAVMQKNRFLVAVLVAAVGAGALGIKGLLGVDSASVALWWGNVTWSALFLLLGCAGILLRRPQREAAAVSVSRANAA